MEEVIIYHNPNCGTSRNVLAMLKQAGISPTIIEYLKTPPSREQLVALLAEMKMSARDLLRKNVPEFEKHGLADEKLSEEDILDAMVEDAILINRPIVVTERGTKLCRPSETVLDLLPDDFPFPFVKENGEVLASR